MNRLTELLNQSAIAADLVTRLASPGARVWIDGPSGSGKATIAGLVATEAEHTKSVVRISGDSGSLPCHEQEQGESET